MLTKFHLLPTAVIVIFAKLSDIYGRKIVFIICIVIFTIFSGGCAAAQTMEQLYALLHTIYLSHKRNILTTWNLPESPSAESKAPEQADALPSAPL